MDKTAHLNAVKRDLNSPNLRPKDAASLIIVDTTQGSPRVLVGRRHCKQKFVPNKYVFPGGRVELADNRVVLEDDLERDEIRKLLHDMKGKATESRARGLALAALRETFEETGLVIGKRIERPVESRSPAWRSYLAQAVIPQLSRLTFVARAITPPRRPRRYDTRFFVVSAEDVVCTVGQGDGEFTELHWATFDEARLFDLHAMTRTVLDDVDERLDTNLKPRRDAPVPYYFTKNGLFLRELIPHRGSS